MQRYLVPVSLSAAVTFALFFVMQALIATNGMELLPDGPRFKVNWERVIPDTPPETSIRLPVPPVAEQPPRMPPLEPLPTTRPGHGIEAVGIGPGDDVEIAPAPGHGFGSDSDSVPIVRVNPAYPAQARMRGLEGFVELEFSITPGGTVASARVTGSSNSIFERAALRAVRKWRYNPRVVEGRAVTREGVRVRLRFELEDA